MQAASLWRDCASIGDDDRCEFAHSLAVEMETSALGCNASLERDLKVRLELQRDRKECLLLDLTRCRNLLTFMVGGSLHWSSQTGNSPSSSIKHLLPKLRGRAGRSRTRSAIIGHNILSF